jgi:hypothetical protein
MPRRRVENGDQDAAELAALADGSLSPERRAAVEARVASSPELADLLAEQQRAVALARIAEAEVEAPAGLRARVEAQRRPRSRQVSRRVVAIAAVAAAVALAVGIGVGVFGSSTSGQTFHSALSGTLLAPGVSGDATLTKTSSGWRIELDASGLPRLDNGQFYEAWLRNNLGVLIPVGTFNEGRRVTLWSGVSPEGSTLTVTREKLDGNQASSGEKVLVGKVPS